MADIADLAGEAELEFLQKALSNVAPGPKLISKGRCHFCDEIFEDDDPYKNKKLFCDNFCEEDYRRLEFAQKQAR